MGIDLVDLGAIVVVLAPLAVLLACLFADPLELELHAPARVLDVPRGVQEEEPRPWRIEALSAPAKRAGRGAIVGEGPERRRRGTQPDAGRLGSRPLS